MLGSSSTTSRRASGAGRPGDAPPDTGAADGGPATAPPLGRADAVVMPRASGPRLRHTWTVPVRTLGERPAPHRSAGGGHGAAVAPVADRVVLGAGEAPPAAQVGADRPHRPRLGRHPGA